MTLPDIGMGRVALVQLTQVSYFGNCGVSFKFGRLAEVFCMGQFVPRLGQVVLSRSSLVNRSLTIGFGDIDTLRG